MNRRNIKKGKIKELILLTILLMINVFVPIITFAAEIDPSSYSASGQVYWDTMTQDSTNGGYKSSSDGSKSNTHIVSVKLNNIDVSWSDSKNKWGMAKGDGTGNKLSVYYPDASKNNMTDAELAITLEKGYRVKQIVVPCSYYGPYMCQTWSDGNAFTGDFEVDKDGNCIIRNLNSKYFSHLPSLADSNNSYFILIEVVPSNSPLYVEYDYGNIDELMNISGSVFENASGWIDANANNNLGTGSVQTNNTQFKYTYTSSATSWKHYASDISDAGKTDAAKGGYYFSGWKAEYYSKASVTQNSSGSYNNYTYKLSEEYATSEYEVGDEVNLATNVRLIAHWSPLELEVIKKVTGLAGTAYENNSRTYSFMLQKQDSNGSWSDYGETFSIAISGDGTNSKTISPILGGTYRVVEIDGNQELQTGNNPTMYVNVSDKSEFVLSKDNISVQTIVTNTYIEELPKTTVNVIKNWDDHENQSGIRPQTISVKLLRNGEVYKEASFGETESWKYTFNDLDTNDSNGNEYVYSIEEVGNIEGYFLSNITKENNTFTLTNSKLGSIEVIIEDSVTGERLKNAKLKLQRLNENSVYEDVAEITTDENGIAKIGNLLHGTYKLTEVKAPDGYSLNEEKLDIELEVGSLQTDYEIKSYNKLKPTLPETGSNEKITIYISCCFFIVFLYKDVNKKFIISRKRKTRLEKVFDIKKE